MPNASVISLRNDVLQRDELFPIREVSRVTGVNPVTLRAWERRYGLIKPTRTAKGHRLYSGADIDRVGQIVAWIGRGVAVSKVGRLLASLDRAEPQTATPVALSDGEHWQERILETVCNFDEPGLSRLYAEIFASHSLVDVFHGLFLPLWRALAGREGADTRSQWLFLDRFLRTRVSQRLQLTGYEPLGPVVMVALPDSCRELDYLVAALLLAAPDLRPLVLSLDQPLVALGRICARTNARGLLLYADEKPGGAAMQLARGLRLEVGCPVLAMGAAAPLLENCLRQSPGEPLDSDPLAVQRRLRALILAGR